MTELASRRDAGSARRVATWIARFQQRLFDRVHAGGDEFARQHAWATTTTERLGFGARTYRDPRFAQLATAIRPSPDDSGGRPDARAG